MGLRGAFWLLLDETIEFRRSLYDFEAAAEETRKSGLPIADDFAEYGILDPPPKDEVLEWLEGRVK